jgi:hypothetical protein
MRHYHNIGMKRCAISILAATLFSGTASHRGALCGEVVAALLRML